MEDQDGYAVKHQFEVTVVGVRSLTTLSASVWGEADCYVQYHFPKQKDTAPKPVRPPDSGLDMQIYRTPTVLCMADPAFDYKVCHAFSLPQAQPIQHALLAVVPREGISFEVWKRYYYPNIRDQLIARVSLFWLTFN